MPSANDGESSDISRDEKKHQGEEIAGNSESA